MRRYSPVMKTEGDFTWIGFEEDPEGELVKYDDAKSELITLIVALESAANEAKAQLGEALDLLVDLHQNGSKCCGFDVCPGCGLSFPQPCARSCKLNALLIKHGRGEI